MKASFEEACAIGQRVATADAFRVEGIPVVMARHRDALAAVGWTLQELCDESQRRMHEQIERMQP